jgi:predicted DNA-binding protein (MmcQ/YjbR family)
MDAKLARFLRTQAMGMPGAEEAIACAGTALESAVFRSKKKSFLFIGREHVRLKLTDSLDEAAALAKKKPEVVEIGNLGWVKLTSAEGVPRKTLERWIQESYRAVVPAPKSSARART